MAFSFNPFTGKLDVIPDLSNYIPYIGATKDVDLGSHSLTTTGSIGISGTPSTEKLYVYDSGNGTTLVNLTYQQTLGGVASNMLYFDGRTANAGGDLRGIYMVSSGIGAFCPIVLNNTMSAGGIARVLQYSNTINATGAVATSYSTETFINVTNAIMPFSYVCKGRIDDTGTTTAPGTNYGYDMIFNIYSAINENSKGFSALINSRNSAADTAYGAYLDIRPDHTGDLYYGNYVTMVGYSGATINNPTNNQIGFYVNNAIVGTDTNFKRWAFFNDGTVVNASKVFLGKDNILTYFGTGYDASFYYDGTDMIINTQVVGTGDLKVLGGSIYPAGYKSSDGSAGITATKTVAVGDVITIKNGIITGYSP